MLSTLVDNSTLTAVQRLIGDVPVALSFAVEGDVAAYDQYLQALLLYDEVAAVDDYKEEYKVERRDSFKEVRFLKPNDLAYDEATQCSIEAVKDIGYEIERGKIASGPMSDFLAALDLHVLPAWYMQSSDWFLHLRILAEESAIDAPKYGALMNTIHAQVSQSDRSVSSKKDSLKIQTRDGKIVNIDATGDGSISSDMKRFSMGLNWIAQRSAFYIDLSNRLSSAFTVHPIRHAFVGQYILKQLTPTISSDIRRGAISFFAEGTEEIRSRSDEIVFSSGMGVKLPFFAAWAVGYAGNPRNGYEHVLQIRSGREAIALRSRFREIEDLAMESDQSVLRQNAAKLRRAIADDLDQLRIKFSDLKKQAPVDASVDMLTLTPSISLTNLAQNIRRAIPSRDRKSTTLLRNISADFMRIPSFGSISDQFTYSRKIRKGTEFVPDRTRIEAKKWQNASSHWKRPV